MQGTAARTTRRPGREKNPSYCPRRAQCQSKVSWADESPGRPGQGRPRSPWESSFSLAQIGTLYVLAAKYNRPPIQKSVVHSKIHTGMYLQVKICMRLSKIRTGYGQYPRVS